MIEKFKEKTETTTNKVYTDCEIFIKNCINQDDDLWEVFHNHEPFTVSIL